MTAESIRNEATSPSEVGWQFVRQYYEHANKHPQVLHRFYAGPSTFSHATEGEVDEPAYGLQDIRDRITAIGFESCQVLIRSVDAQSSADGGIIVQVVGEMTNRGEACKKFAQTILLAKQAIGYFVLNDIFRFLKENSGIGECEDTEEQSTDEKPGALPVPEPASGLSPPQTPTTESVGVSPVSKLRAKSGRTPVAVKPEPTPAEESPILRVNALAVKPHSTSAPDLATTPVQKSPPSATSPIQQTQPKPRSPPQQMVPQPKMQAKSDGANPKDSSSVATSEPRGVPEVRFMKSPPNAPVPPTRGHGQHFAYVAAQNTTNPQCFVKRVVETVTEEALREAVTSRFGPFKELEIVRTKACAFIEFENIESARLAITASLPPAQGGDGGVRIDTEDGGNTRIFIEARRPRGGGVMNRPRRGIGQGIGGDNDGRGGYRGRGYGGPRGRGSPKT